MVFGRLLSNRLSWLGTNALITSIHQQPATGISALSAVSQLQSTIKVG